METYTDALKLISLLVVNLITICVVIYRASKGAGTNETGLSIYLVAIPGAITIFVGNHISAETDALIGLAILCTAAIIAFCVLAVRKKTYRRITWIVVFCIGLLAIVLRLLRIGT